MSKCDFGLIGLAVMGQNLVLNAESKGFSVAVYNRTEKVTSDFLRKHKEKNIVGAKNSINFIKSNFSRAIDLLKPKDPNDLVDKIKEHTKHFHIYTFGGLKETNNWLKENNYA